MCYNLSKTSFQFYTFSLEKVSIIPFLCRYITYTEWTTLYGGKRSGRGTTSEEDASFKRLPFDHCCVSLLPFENPYCDNDGNIFELQPVLEFVKKFKVNPVSGKVGTSTESRCKNLLVN